MEDTRRAPQEGDIVYITLPEYMDKVIQGILIKKFTNRYDRGSQSNSWVIKIKHNGNIEYRMFKESQFKFDDAEYKKLLHRQELKDKIEELQTKLDEL